MAVTQVNIDNFQDSIYNTLGGPRISSVFITDSSYNNLDDTDISTSGGYIKIIGTGFMSACNVLVGTTASTSTTFVSSNEIRAQIPALNAGTYLIYVINTNGSYGVVVNGLTVSSTPTWVTGSTLTGASSGIAYSNQLSATGDAPITYALQAGSTLPTGLTLSSGGLLSGTITVGSDTTYNFTIVAVDGDLQDSPRTFSLTVSTFTLFVDGSPVTLTNNAYDLNTAGAYTLTVSSSKSVTLKMWGAGGGSGGATSGGLGGYAAGTITLQPSTNYIVWVGGGGRRNNANGGSGYAGGFGGGGLTGTTNAGDVFAGSGGGLTGMFLSSATLANSILIAGGGGGGAGGATGGGNGGGTTGGTGGSSGSATGGGGGTQSAGGTVGSGGPYNSGSTAGTALTGGKGATDASTNFTGGGGGGGYYGGGGGRGNNTVGGAGGGGSGYINTSLITGGSLSGSGTGGTVPNNLDSYYKNNAGTASALTAAATAPPGLFVIIVN